MQSSINKEVFKFPAKPPLRKYLKEYIDGFEFKSKGVAELSADGNRDDTAFLLRVCWAVAQV